MKTLIQDLRYAMRRLRKDWSLSLTAVVSLLCGIAATTAVFSVVYGVLVNPYPYAAADRMAHLSLGSLDASGGYNGFNVTPDQWRELRSSPLVEDTVLTYGDSLTLTGKDVPEDVSAERFSSNGWNFFGVPAVLGRGIVPSDAVGGADPAPVAVLGNAFWQRRFGGDPAIIGKTIELAGKPYTVVGVAARRFTWGDADLYLPMKMSSDPHLAGQAELRLKPGVTHAMVEQQLQPLVTRFAKETPAFFPPRIGPLHVIGLNEQFLKALGPTLALLFGAVSLLLLIGCGNVSILLLARGTARQHEFAVRAAIGASRARIVRQLLTEALVLSVTGAGLGVLVSYKLLRLIVGLLPENAFPHEAAIAINLPVLVFCVVVAVGTGVLFGLSPALRLSRPDVREAMQAGARRVAGGGSSRTAHHVLIAGQIALTLLLLTTATAAIQAFLRLSHTPLGYEPHNVVALYLPLRDGAFPSIERRSAYVGQLRDRLAETPGVQAVAVSTNATPPDSGFTIPAEVLGVPKGQDNLLRWNLVSRDYFSLLHVPLHSGRVWTGAEEQQASLVAVVNQAFAKKYFPDGMALGHSVKTDALKPQPPYVVVKDGAEGWRQIVGVTEDKLNSGLSKPVLPEVSVPYTTGMGPVSQLLVRTDGPPLAMLPALRRKIAEVDGSQQVGGRVRDLEGWIASTPEYARGELMSWLFGGFAALALGLAAVGLYSVVSYTVAQRTNEFGIRMALGALRSDVLRLVARSTAVSLGVGAALGVVLSVVLLRVLASLLGGASGSREVGALLLAVGLLAVVAAVAAGLPSRRATRIEPMEALRYE
ncbi:ADOP family duplicated permease [Terriglobus sp.]|uniref:ADOP family duplicated permease n=1 Tax=Terriglobus sp. TaxID=1889013 RepID=UPI003B009ED1